MERIFTEKQERARRPRYILKSMLRMGWTERLHESEEAAVHTQRCLCYVAMSLQHTRQHPSATAGSQQRFMVKDQAKFIVSSAILSCTTRWLKGTDISNAGTI